MDLTALFNPSIQGRLVHRDQCSRCFHSVKHKGGVNLSLMNFNSYCERHLKQAWQKKGLRLFLNVQMVQKKKQQPVSQIKRLAIGVQDGFNDLQKEYQTHFKPFLFDGKEKDYQLPEDPKLQGLIQSVQAAPTAFQKQALAVWQAQTFPCQHTLTLQQVQTFDTSKPIPTKCSQCNLSAGLWLCLTCGHVGCGRKNYDGTGGNGHAIAHNQQSKHPLVVKLGTISEHGKASCFCYGCQQDVVDQHLGVHLSVFGVRVQSMAKTEKTMDELNLQLNLNAKFYSKLIQEGKQLKLLYGPGFTGIDNIGNSCYLNSVLQLLFTIPRFQHNYLLKGKQHSSSCKSDPSECLFCQMHKLFKGLAQGECGERQVRVLKSSKDELQIQEQYQEGIAPYDFKRLIASKHAQFSSFRQQDALQYLQWFLDQTTLLQKKEALPSTSEEFQFTQLNKLTCINCQGVKLNRLQTNQFVIPVPPPAVMQQGSKEACQDPQYPVELRECLQELKEGSLLDLKCKCGCEVFRSRSFLQSSPKYLLLKANRFIIHNLKQKKLNALIGFKELEIDLLQHFFTALAPAEHLLKDSSSQSFPESQILMLTEMGISRNKALRALRKTKGNVEAAVMWSFENQGANLDDPIQQQGEGPSQQLIKGLTQFGFSEMQAKVALLQFKTVENAANFLFESGGDVTPYLHLLEAKPEKKAKQIISTRYKVIGTVVHLGRGVHSGHYVCYRERGEKWLLFNDNKVGETKPLLEKGYFYLFQRL